MDRRIITLTTDFGLSDGFVGIVKGVILSLAPDVSIVDITHDVKAFDISSGAWVIQNARSFFPEDAIHVVIVDPGVGSQRRCLALATHHGVYLAPDNGVLSSIATDESAAGITITHLNKPQYWRETVSSTFQARDIFAPVAARIASGMSPQEMGDQVKIDSIVLLDSKAPRSGGSFSEGEVVYVDRFGNLITNISATLSALTDATCLLNGRPVGKAVKSYFQVAEGEVAVVAGSHGFIEIAVNQGNAAAVLAAGVGSSVRLQVNE